MSSESPKNITLFPKSGKGIVEQVITESQPGRVSFQATYWPARLYNSEQEVTLLPNTPVTIVGRQGITLLVVPVEIEDSLEANLNYQKASVNAQPLGWTEKFGSWFKLRLN